MKPLEGKVALVLGASRGIGKGIALELGDAGALVYVTGRTLEGAGEHRPGSVNQTVREIEANGGHAVAVQCDATDDEQLADLMQRIMWDHGKLHVLVNTVFDAGAFGATIGKKFWELPLSVWRDTVDVPTRSAYVACVEAAQLLLAAGADTGALIVNVSSLGAIQYFYNVAYGAGKAAVDKMTADMALDLAGTGVAVVSLWPNVTRTEGVEAAIAAGNTKAYEMFGGVDKIETPRYNGRGVVALATDPNVMEKTGKYFWTAQLGEEYGFVDENGRPHGYPGRKKKQQQENAAQEATQ